MSVWRLGFVWVEPQALYSAELKGNATVFQMALERENRALRDAALLGAA